MGLERIERICDFKGTATRMEWLKGMAFFIVLLMILYQIGKYDLLPITLLSLLQTVSVALVAALCTRRVHDLGISGRWFGAAVVFAIAGGPMLLSLAAMFIAAPLSLTAGENGMPDPAALERAMRFGGFMENLGANGLYTVVFVLPAAPLFILLILMAIKKGRGPRNNDGHGGEEAHPWGVTDLDAAMDEAIAQQTRNSPAASFSDTPRRPQPAPPGAAPRQGFGRKGL